MNIPTFASGQLAETLHARAVLASQPLLSQHDVVTAADWSFGHAGARGTDGHLHTRSPKTGVCLRFGPAMRQAATSVHLPGVAALFADIASEAPQRPWDLRPPSPLPVRLPLRCNRSSSFQH